MMDVGNGRICPLLHDPNTYNPDTIDLIHNIDARNYWLPCLEQMVKKFINRAGILNPDKPNATDCAQICFEQFHELIEKEIDNPQILKPLSIRTLLEFNEGNLRDNNFKDAWYLQKRNETMTALKEFKNRIEWIDAFDEFDAKWMEIVTGVLAGNIFDWGSNSVANLLENSHSFGFSHAMETIEKRPWFIDDLNKWVERLKISSYRKAVIFVDNAGVDFILGIMPMVRELISHGTKVILSANSFPALNDLTINEMKLYCSEAAKNCSILETALQTGQLLTIENGQKGPCLDLSTLNSELCELMETADLVVLEGMGRAVHTNFYAKFKVDSLKLAVLKNEWLAKSLGAKQFSVICRYETT